MAMHWGDIFYFSIGALVWLFAWPDMTEAATLPTFSTLLTSWVMRVVFRNLLINVFIYEAWHQLLFGALATDSVKIYRYNAKDPYEAGRNLRRERFFSMCGFCWSSAYEIMVIYSWASAAVPSCGQADLAPSQLLQGGCLMEDPNSLAELMERPLWLGWFLLAVPLVTQFRGVHFFFCHRMMHPWWDRRGTLAQGDIGAFLYRHVHSLHHKSHNPGPWSSLSMHPIEHFFYFSCFLLAWVVPFHPLHLLLTKYHTDISALAGHDGYGPPGADDVGHYLHHAHFECNYGFSFPNYLDRLFGTYEDGSRWANPKPSDSHKTVKSR